MKPYLFLIRGLPGSGKSTLAENLRSAYAHMYDVRDVVHFETDMWMKDEDGNYNFNPSKLSDAHDACRMAVKWAMDGNGPRGKAKVVIVSNTFVRKWEMDPYADMAIKYGYQLVIVEARGNYGSVHNVPEATLERMRDNWENV